MKSSKFFFVEIKKIFFFLKFIRKLDEIMKNFEKFTFGIFKFQIERSIYGDR